MNSNNEEVELPFDIDENIVKEKIIEKEEIVEDRFGRFKGLSWFNYLKNKDVIVGGCGGIGSWVTLLLSRLGCNIHVFDYDTIEAHNISGQNFRISDIGLRKTEAIVNIVKEFSNHTSISAYDKYDEDSFSGDIVISCFDNMEARKIMFNNWTVYLESLDEQAQKECIFIDGRLLSEQFQILCVPGWDLSLITKYRNDYLFDDSEVQEVDCTIKQTTHIAAMIASTMIGFLTNFAANIVDPINGRVIPFYKEYILPLDLNLKENSNE